MFYSTQKPFKRIKTIITMRCRHIAPQLVNLDFLRSRATRGTLEVLASETMFCFECGERLQERGGELVCTGCGVVWGNGVPEDTFIPFEEDNQRRDFEGRYMPGSELAFNRGLGTNQYISKGSFCRIVASVKKEDLGLRARHLRVLTTRAEHPWIVNLLETGSKICKDFDLHRKDNACVRFADRYGGVLRQLGAFIIIRGEHWSELKKMARAAFVLLYKEFAGKEKAEEARQQLGIDHKFLNYVRFLIDTLTPKHRRARKH